MSKEKINVDLDSCETLICNACEGKEWYEVYTIKRVSALLSPNGKEMIVPIPIIKCVNCGMTLEESEEKNNEDKK